MAWQGPHNSFGRSYSLPVGSSYGLPVGSSYGLTRQTADKMRTLLLLLLVVVPGIAFGEVIVCPAEAQPAVRLAAREIRRYACKSASARASASVLNGAWIRPNKIGLSRKAVVGNEGLVASGRSKLLTCRQFIRV